MITEKDRGQLLRMAGNIAGGIVGSGDFDRHYDDDQIDWIAMMAARIAFGTMQRVDQMIAESTETE